MRHFPALALVSTLACAISPAWAALCIDKRPAVTVARPVGTIERKGAACGELASRPRSQLSSVKPAPPAKNGLPGSASKTASVKPVGGSRIAVSTRRSVSGATGKTPRASAFIVAIDAGHGGKDTGAIGPNGTLEKHVVFAIARKLEGMINAQSNMRAVMVRKRDEFIELADRAEIARKAKADLLISLHADAYDNGEARGSSVFTLSRSGASSVAARWLADSENAADLVGGVKLKGRGRLLASVLLDLSQNGTIEASDRAAIRVLRELQKNGRLHQGQVQKAGFVVLKSPDVPSVLVETAFISNVDEEKSLNDAKYQMVLARSIFNGIRSFSTKSVNREPVPQIAASEPAVRFIAQH